MTLATATLACLLFAGATPVADGAKAPRPSPLAPSTAVAARAATAPSTVEALATAADTLGNPSVSGFIRPSAVIRYRPNALPRDTWNYGVENALLIVAIEKQPSPIFGYKLTLLLTASMVPVLTDVHLTTSDGDAQPPGLSTNSTSVVGNLIDEASIYIQPLPGIRLRLGQMRVPYTLELWSVWAHQLFWERASPTSYFLPATDFGALAELTPFGENFTLRAGVYNGSGISAGTGKDRGLMYGFRFDISPLGPAEVLDHRHDDFRISVGSGLFYYPSKVFDSAGYVTSHAQDLRLDISLRMTLYGFSFQGEYLRRQGSDSVSSQRKVDAGWYAQGAYYLPVADLWGVGPTFRWGTVTTEATFLPRTTRWIETGFSLFSGDGTAYNAVQLQFIYAHERRMQEGDSAHLILTRYLVQF